MDGNRNANIRCLIVLIITAVIGGVNLLLCGVKGSLALFGTYVLAMVVSIPMIWFSYSMAKWHNKRHAYLHERDGAGDGEPSDWGIIRIKIEGWSLYIVGLILSALPILIG